MSPRDEDKLPDDEHLRDDVGALEPENDSAAKFDGGHFTSSLLNAGQKVPGLSPDGEYRQSENPEHENEPGQDGFVPPSAPAGQ